MSRLDGWPIIVLDADIRSDDPAHREAARQAWRELVGGLKPTVKTAAAVERIFICAVHLTSYLRNSPLF
jgi:hypothetical protein